MHSRQQKRWSRRNESSSPCKFQDLKLVWDASNKKLRSGMYKSDVFPKQWNIMFRRVDLNGITFSTIIKFQSRSLIATPRILHIKINRRTIGTVHSYSLACFFPRLIAIVVRCRSDLTRRLPAI